MRCRKAHEYISRSIDGELSRAQENRLERHLAGCEDCRALREDLRTIVAGAAKLDAPQPSDAVWLKIRTGLVRERGGRTAADAATVRRPLPWLSLPALRYAGVAAVALVLVVTGAVLGRRWGRPAESLGPEAGARYTLAKLDEAEGYYQRAIKSLSEAFAAEKGSLAPQIVEMFDHNLSVVDATIKACREAVVAEPDDLEARNYLLAAYTQKITLLDSALDLQRGRNAAGKSKIL